MRFTTDVLVVGGGPAGAAAAIVSARAGLRVILVEKAPTGRGAVGEALHPGVESVFRRLGVWEAIQQANFKSYSGHAVAWDGVLRFIHFGRDHSGEWLGLQAWRADLDLILLKKARYHGTTVLHDTRAQTPTIRNGRVNGIRTDVGQITARWVIDASGRSGFLGRHLQLERQTASPPLFAAFAYSACDTRLNHAPVLIADATGWGWRSIVKTGVEQNVRLAIGADRQQRRRSFDATFSAQPRGVDVTWRLLNETAGAGYFIVGDAGCVLDPSSSHGVLHALLSGMLAGELCVDQSYGTVGERKGTRHFKEYSSHCFWRDASGLDHLYRASAFAALWDSTVKECRLARLRRGRSRA